LVRSLARSHSQRIRYKHTRKKVKVQGHSLSEVKRYKSGSDRLMDFILGMVLVITAENDWPDVGRPQVAMHAQLSHFLAAVSTGPRLASAATKRPPIRYIK